MSETSDVSRYYVYTLRSNKNNRLYIGFTSNLKNRLTLHSKGQVPSTKLDLPYTLIHYEYFINIQDAKSREKYLKSGYGRDQLKQFLKNTLR